MSWHHFTNGKSRLRNLGRAAQLQVTPGELVPNGMAEPRREPREFHAVHLVASLMWKDRINPTQELTFSPCIDGK